MASFAFSLHCSAWLCAQPVEGKYEFDQETVTRIGGLCQHQCKLCPLHEELLDAWVLLACTRTGLTCPVSIDLETSVRVSMLRTKVLDFAPSLAATKRILYGGATLLAVKTMRNWKRRRKG